MDSLEIQKEIPGFTQHTLGQIFESFSNEAQFCSGYCSCDQTFLGNLLSYAHRFNVHTEFKDKSCLNPESLQESSNQSLNLSEPESFREPLIAI